MTDYNRLMETMKRAPRIVIALVVLSTAAGFGYERLTRDRSPDSIEVTGTVEAREADLGFQAAGRLERLNAREGDLIEVGTELAALDRSELLAERAVALARIDAAQAYLTELVRGSRAEDIARAEALLSVAEDRQEAARRDVERLRPLAQQELVSQQTFDHQETAADVAVGEADKAREELKLLRAGTRPERIAAQRAAVAEATATLARIDALLGQSTVTAPFGGVVTVRHREPGEAIQPGTPVLTLQNLSDRWVRAYVPGDEVGRLSLGQCAVITADAFAEREYAGVVSYISSVAEFTPRNVQSTKDRVRLVYEVRIRIVGDDAIDLKPGLPGDVSFETSVGQAVASAGCTAPATVAVR